MVTINANDVNITTPLINLIEGGDGAAAPALALPATSAAKPYAATTSITLYEGNATIAVTVAKWDAAAGKSVAFATSSIVEYGYTQAEFDDAKAALSAWLGAFTFSTLREYATWIVRLLQAFADLTEAQYANA